MDLHCTEEIAHTPWFTIAYNERELVAIKSNVQSFLMLGAFSL